MENIRIPTREEHRRSVKRIWAICALCALSVLVGMGGMVATLLVRNIDLHRVMQFSTICFQVLIAMFAIGFTVPLFLEQRANLMLSLEMGRQSLEYGYKMTAVLEKLDISVEDRLKRSDLIFDRIEKFLDTAEKGDHPIVKTFEREMEALRAEIRAKKNEADDELNAALDEGEREANNLPEGT